ncbi:MAG TPA: hypothetical protein VLB72_02685 [Burkholderiales bacterium]|nr:hypothetical protein [Burkholderiales bacterium]
MPTSQDPRTRPEAGAGALRCAPGEADRGYQARRGWLEAKDVLNTRSLKELRPLLARTMGR